MSAVTYLVVGASRSIGLETARQLLAQSPSNRIIAAARKPSEAKLLQALSSENEGRVELLELDISSEASVKKAGEAVKELSFAKDGIDVVRPPPLLGLP